MRVSGKQLTREWPLALGVAAGAGLAWWRGHAFVLDDVMEGYGWPGYVMNSWVVAHRMPGRYDQLRGLLHAGLMGELGEAIGSYANAALLISSLSGLALILSAAIAGRALGGRWAGALAAVCLPLAPKALNAFRWANTYPLASAFAGIALALAAACARWPRVRLAAAIGLCTGLAWAADGRTLTFAPVIFVMAGLGAMRAKRWRRRLLIPVLLVAGLAAKPAVERHYQAPPGYGLPWENKLRMQRPVVARWVRITDDRALTAACQDEPLESLLTVDALWRPCAREMVRHNLERRLPGHLAFGGWATLIALPFWLLPAGRGRRGFFDGLMFMGGCAGALGALSLWTPLADRYLVHHILPLAIAVPVAVARIGRSVPIRWLRGPTALLLCVAAGVWTWRVDPIERDSPAMSRHMSHYLSYDRLRTEVEARLSPGDRFQECGNGFVNLAILPRRLASGLPLHRADNDVEHCQNWIASPDLHEPGGQRWISIDPSLRVQLKRRGRLTGEETTLAQLIETSGDWTEVWSQKRYAIYQWTGAAP